MPAGADIRKLARIADIPGVLEQICLDLWLRPTRGRQRQTMTLTQNDQRSELTHALDLSAGRRPKNGRTTLVNLPFLGFASDEAQLLGDGTQNMLRLLRELVADVSRLT